MARYEKGRSQSRRCLPRHVGVRLSCSQSGPNKLCSPVALVLSALLSSVPSRLRELSELEVLQCHDGVDVLYLCRRIICAEPAKERQGIAKNSGADNIVNPLKEDVAEVCMKLTDVSLESQRENEVTLTFHATQGRGVDVAFDAAGLTNGNTLNMAVKCTRSLGKITNIAIYGAPVNFDLHALYMGEKTLNGIIGDFVSIV